MSRRKYGDCKQCRYWSTKYAMTLPEYTRPWNAWYPCVACHHKGRKPILYPSRNFWEPQDPKAGSPSVQSKKASGTST